MAALTTNIDNTFEEVIIPRMVFSASREGDGNGEGDIDFEGILEDVREGKCMREERDEGEREKPIQGVDPFGIYLRDIGREAILSRAQEFRVALMAEACKLLAEDWDTSTKAWGRRHIWEEVYHQLGRAWKNVQGECRERGLSPPVLQKILAEASTLPRSLRDLTPLYVQEYLMALGWGKGRQEKEEEVERADVAKVAKDLCIVTEGIALLPPSLQKLLRDVAESGQGFPHTEDLFQHIEELVATGELQLHERWIADRGIAARELLGITNTRLAVKMAKKFRQEGGDLQDLVGEANIALVRATHDFQPYRGTRFCTLAGTYIGNAFRSHMRTERKNPITGARSFDEPVGKSGDNGEELAIEDTIAAKTEGPVEAAYQLMLHEMLQEVLQTIPERERQIVILRHGLEGKPPYTLEQIGEIFALTRERIRQLEMEGEVKIIRQIARRFPDLLPTGMSPELALIVADQKLGKKFDVEP